MRYLPLLFLNLCLLVGILLVARSPVWGGVLLVVGLIGSLVGLLDLVQNAHAVRKNYPITARVRYLLESIRPEIRQYFLESDHDEVPFSREQRALAYRRAKGIKGVRPFGTLKNVQQIGYEWINHSMLPTHIGSSDFRVDIGGDRCTRPYNASVLNISGMSYGALSANAIEALNRGAAEGGFAHTTGEGSISRHHAVHGGDLVWQIGSGYFGCRDDAGNFDPTRFAARATDPQVKMIEVKLSQGAKPGHGGMLPGRKVTPIVAEARGIAVGEDCFSPASHSAFQTPMELLEFLDRLRTLSGGKPVGFKLCVGHPWEIFAIARAMQESDLLPDFITIDGSEGGTGAAPVEFADHIGAPLREGLMLVHNTLVGLGIREKVTLIVSGKLISAFDIARMFALGADACNMARGFMFALGCIQAQACHTDQCPTGVATTDPKRYKALSVARKHVRVAQFHRNTLTALQHAVEAAGLMHPAEFTPHHLMMRVSSREVRSASSQYEWLEPGALLTGKVSHPAFDKYWYMARSDTFECAPSSVRLVA